jgi:hypothetical protein
MPFRSGYHALLGQTAFGRFNAIPHYAYLKPKMPGPNGIITVNGNTERSLHIEEQTAALATKARAAEKASRLDSAPTRRNVAPRLRETGTPRIPAQRSSLLEYDTTWHRTNQLFITNNTGTKVLKALRLHGHGDTSPAQIALC